MASWNAVAHAQIDFTASSELDALEPSIGNGRNEFGWVESSNSPYFIPGIPCTTAYIYDTASGLMEEADTTCNGLFYQWPDNMFGLFTQENVIDAESAAVTALGTWLGLDASLQFGDPMSPVVGSGVVRRFLLADELAFARSLYGDGSSVYGSITGRVQRPDHSAIPFAYVAATGQTGNQHGAVADATGAYSILEMPAGSYSVATRPLTTNPYVLSSVPYRANPIGNLDFTPQFYGGRVEVSDGSASTGIDLTTIRTGSQPDGFEPNDSAAAASPFSFGFFKLATTNTLWDTDWYSFQTSAQTCYVVQTGFHGASILPTLTEDTFWSRTRLSLYEGGSLIGRNDSVDSFQLHPGNWLSYCEGSTGRRLDVEIEQREPVGGAGYFYTVFVQPIDGGATQSPTIGTLYPSSGWSHRNRYVWIAGAGFLPGAHVDIRPAGSSWIAVPEAIATWCDAAYRCDALKALFPPGAPGPVDVRVTNPNGQSATKLAGFTYVQSGDGPVDDRTPQAFGTRFGQGKAVCIGDYDGDGDDDILKTRYGFLPVQLFRNNGDGTFSDVAATAGLHSSAAVFGRSCAWVDVDDDGDLDAYLTNVAYSLPSGSTNELFVNRMADGGGARFDAATPAGLGGIASRYKSDAAWADYNNDGRLDVVLAYDSYAGSPPYGESVQLFRQNGNGSFSDVTASSGLGGYFASITSVLAADFNNDHCDDLVFFTYGGVANRLYKGDCRGHFAEATTPSHLASGTPWCAGTAVADFNNDGNADIFCGTYNSGPGSIPPRLWLNNGHAVFTDRAAEAGLLSVSKNMDVILPIDEDNDGLTDVYVGSSERGWPDDRKDVLLRNVGGNPPVFLDVTEGAGMFPTTQDGSGLCVPGIDEFYCDRDASAGGVLDWYDDGAQDVFVTGDDPDVLQRGADFLWRNRRNIVGDGSIAPANDWIEVALRGANTPQSRVLSNRLGIGARVTVIPRLNLPTGAAPTETLCLQNPLPPGVASISREVVAGNRSQSSMVLHFGLGSAMPFGEKRVDCIKVLWPSGLERAYTGITANNRVVLAEDAAHMKVISVVPNTGSNARSDPTTILGLRFDRDLTTVPQVYFGSVPALSVSFVSDHELTVLPPLWQSPGTVDVTVVNTDGERDTLLAGYTYSGVANGLRIKDPVPSLITLAGTVPNDPSLLASRGAERTGVIADGVTRLVLEAEVAGPGNVRFALDDNDHPDDTAPSATDVGAITPIAGGVGGQVVTTVQVTALSDGRFVAHALYVSPTNFVRNDADKYLGLRGLWVHATYVDASAAEHPFPSRVLGLFRVPVLYVHGMWGSSETITWRVLNDPRWIALRGDYSATNDVGFEQNEGVPPRLVAEVRKQINDRGIAGTRVFVFAFSMGAVLFKAYMSDTAAPYARADNFFAGDVYALVPIDAPFHGSYLASFVRYLRSKPLLGPTFTSLMHSMGMDVDRGCMESLDPEGSDIRNIPAIVGSFHAIVGWGGQEMRTAGLSFGFGSKLASLQSVLRVFNAGFESFILRCDSGDDFIVCVDSQRGGMTGAHVSDFHFAGPSAMAVHFASICEEEAPSAAAEELLNTPTSDASVWEHVLPQAPVTFARPAPARVPKVAESRSPTRDSLDDGLSLTLTKQGDGVSLSWVGAATRLLKSFSATLVPGVCLAASGTNALDAHALTVPVTTYYAVGTDALCSPQSSLTIASVSPSSGSSMGGYRITLLGSGFTSATRVRIGEFYATDVVIVDSTTLTCVMIPGDAGAAMLTVLNSNGQVATTTFTYVEPAEVPGSVQITAPQSGSSVAVGSTITIAATGSGGFKIAKALAFSRGVASDDDHDLGEGFTTSITLPPDSIGPMTIELVARDANGNLKSAAPVTITAVVPGDVSLLRLDAARMIMLYASPAQQLHVFGIFSDGVRRDISHVPGVVFEMDTQDIRKPNYPYNGTGVAVVDSAGLVTAKTQGTTVCHVSYSGHTLDVVVEVAEIRPTVGVQKPGFISWPYQGPGVTYDVVRGTLSALRTTGGNFTDTSVGLACIKDNFVNVTAADVANPPAGEAFFYVMRESRTLSYEESPFWPTRGQIGRRTTEIGAATGACP